MNHSGNIEWIIDDFDLYFDLDANCCYELYSTVVTSGGGLLVLQIKSSCIRRMSVGLLHISKIFNKI